MSLMHEWILLSIEAEWKSARLTMYFDTFAAGVVTLTAEGVVDLHIPHVNPWGPSVHVNEVRERSARNRKCRKLEIEMQSGDTITITAAAFVFPPQARNTTPLLETTDNRGRP